MAALLRAQVVLAMASNVSADACVNTFHFRTNQDNPLFGYSDLEVITGERPLAIDENGIHGDLSDFYIAMSQFMSSDIDWTNSVIRWFNLDEPAPRFPIYEAPIKDGAASFGPPMPSEVAIVASFQGEKLSGINQARRRNRVYIGPLLGTLPGSDGNNFGRVPAAVQNGMVLALANFATNSAAAGQWSWRVYSGTTGQDIPVKSGWVDNAWDTQRRRGVSSSSRVVWNVSSV